MSVPKVLLISLLFMVFFLGISLFVFSAFFLRAGLFRFPLKRCTFFDKNSFFVFDDYTRVCMLMLFICGMVVLPFLFHYMGSYNVGQRLFFLVCSFILVMGLLILRGDFLSRLLGWEYLGLVSYLLILFLCKASSIRASLITLFASRFGDVSLFFLVGLSNYIFFKSYVLDFFLLLVVLTKRACFPFTS